MYTQKSKPNNDFGSAMNISTKSEARSKAMAFIVVGCGAFAVLSGCATSNLADNPLNRAAGVVASALAGVNRSVSAGFDAVDRTAMNVNSKAASLPNEYYIGATLGTRRDTGPGPNPDTTYRPALDMRARAICQGNYGLLNEHNSQATVAFQRRIIEERVKRGETHLLLEPYERTLLDSYPEAGLVWHVKCGEGKGWRAPAPSRIDYSAISGKDRENVVATGQNIDRIVAGVPALQKPIFPKATLVVPTELEAKGILLREGQANPQWLVLTSRIAIEGLARGVERRNIFSIAEIVEGTRLPEATPGNITVYFDGEEVRFQVPGKERQVVRLDPKSYSSFVTPISGRGIRLDEGVELAVAVIEQAASRAMVK